MASRLNTADEHEHRPARSGTPTAWMALILLAALICSGLFFETIVCGMLRMGLSALAWNQRIELSINHLALGKSGTIQAQGVSVSFGVENHRSSLKSDLIEVQISSIGSWLGFSKNRKYHFIHQLVLGKSKLLVDRRGGETNKEEEKGGTLGRGSYAIPWIRFLPNEIAAGPVDLVMIGDSSRIAVNGLYASLPDRWTGKVVFAEATLDVGSVHQSLGTTSTFANWDGSTLRLGKLALAKGAKLEELTLSPQRDHLDFGLRGSVGEGLIRGDGSVAMNENRSSLAVTLVGENLRMEALSMLLNEGEQRAVGTIRQGRITFRGDPEHPLEADSSLRLVADNFRWEGRGWDSLRLAATLTGRSFTLSELVLLQKENKVVAQGQSKLPEDWHEALRAPFTVSFHAELDDAGALAALAGSDLAQLSGGLELEGAVKGGENKAEGYCNLLSTGMKVRNLPIDWLKGCLLFEGKKTHLSNLEAWSGKDRIVMQGIVENSLPRAYMATAQFNIGNLTKRLAQLGISTAEQIGGGAVQGTWSGDGSIRGHSGTFAAKAKDWISPWTQAGMSGSFEGSYSPGHLYCSKAEFQWQDLQLGFQLAGSPTRLEAKSIIATRKGKSDPLIRGEVSLPVNAPAIWQSGRLIPNLRMKDALALQLEFHGIKLEELADLLGQKSPYTGNLEGNLAISGTPEIPEIHSALQIAKLMLPDAKMTISMTCAFDSSAGRATCRLMQDPAKEPPMMIQTEMPFQFIANNGKLSFANESAAIHAVATLHSASLNIWLTPWNNWLFPGTPAWNVRDGFLDGAVTLDGTVAEPLAEGTLILKAAEASISGLPLISHLVLPIISSHSKAEISGGTAFLGTNPLAIAGSFDWGESPWRSQLNVTGTNLLFPVINDLQGRGDASLSLGLEGTNKPLLSGKLMIKELVGPLPNAVMPSFVPPGIDVTHAIAIPQMEGNAPVRIDLQVQTEGFLPMRNPPSTDPVQLQADFHVQGGGSTVLWSGNIVAKDYTLTLPAGQFLIPEAKLLADNQGGKQLSFTAYGLTQQGFCTIQHTGDLQSVSSMELLTPVNGTTTTEADLLLALSTPEQTKCPPLNQTPAWIRQNELFQTPPIGWMNRRGGAIAAESLGFYGRPWSMILQPRRPTVVTTSPSLKESQRASKK
jgi:hypothetical protein